MPDAGQVCAGHVSPEPRYRRPHCADNRSIASLFPSFLLSVCLSVCLSVFLSYLQTHINLFFFKIFLYIYHHFLPIFHLIYWLASRFYLSFLQEFIIFVCFIFLLIVDQRKKEKRNQQQKKEKNPKNSNRVPFRKSEMRQGKEREG